MESILCIVLIVVFERIVFVWVVCVCIINFYVLIYRLFVLGKNSLLFLLYLYFLVGDILNVMWSYWEVLYLSLRCFYGKMESFWGKFKRNVIGIIFKKLVGKW